MIDEKLGDQMRVTVIATGFDESRRLTSAPVPEKRSMFAPTFGPAPRREARAEKKAENLLPQTIEAFEMDEEVLDIPKFLREKD